MAGPGADRDPEKAQNSRGLGLRLPREEGGPGGERSGRTGPEGKGKRRQRLHGAGERGAGRHLRREEKNGAGRVGKEAREREAGCDRGLRSRGEAGRKPSITPFRLAHWLRLRRPRPASSPRLARKGRAEPLVDFGSVPKARSPWLGVEGAAARGPSRAGAGLSLWPGDPCPVLHSRSPSGGGAHSGPRARSCPWTLGPRRPRGWGWPPQPPGPRAASRSPAHQELTPCGPTPAAARPSARLAGPLQLVLLFFLSYLHFLKEKGPNES